MDEIIRCAAGKGTKFAEQQAFVENLGTSVNTLYDEYGPVPSPIYPDRLYFTSSRAESTGGLYDPSGGDDLKYGIYRSDLYFTEHQNGVWRSAEKMGDVLNSARHELLYGFSTDGQRMFFLSGSSDVSGDLIIDTFSVYNEGSMIASRYGPFSPSDGDRDLYVFSDSVMLFSSNRPGGFGGYDLYYSLKHAGNWGSAVNLGGVINSFYDERCPFLARNGRKLFFSSNNLKSIGGLDIFEANFDDSRARWSAPVNKGVPINSAADDAYFRISPDGLTAYFSSDRKEGYGGSDLYAAYLKTIIQEHLILSVPITFAHVDPSLVSTDSDAIVASEGDEVEKKEYFIGDLQFRRKRRGNHTPEISRNWMCSPNMMQIYPTITCDLICHDVRGESRSFDLYFSIKKAEQAADYLIRKGVKPEQLYVKGCGAILSPGNCNQRNAELPCREQAKQANRGHTLSYR